MDKNTLVNIVVILFILMILVGLTIDYLIK